MVSRKPPDQVKGEDFEKPARASSGRKLKGEKQSELPTQHQKESWGPLATPSQPQLSEAWSENETSGLPWWRGG